jgi:hypothetical protein
MAPTGCSGVAGDETPIGQELVKNKLRAQPPSSLPLLPSAVPGSFPVFPTYFPFSHFLFVFTLTQSDHEEDGTSPQFLKQPRGSSWKQHRVKAKLR